MSYIVPKDGSSVPLLFLMTDSADHITGKTGLTPTVTISKNGAAFASPAGAVSEISGGWYKVAGNATDSNTAGPLALHATSAGADPTDTVFDCQTVVSSVDGVELGSALAVLLAKALGKAVKTDNMDGTYTYDFYAQDAATVKFSITPSTTDGSRAAGGVIDP